MRMRPVLNRGETVMHDGTRIAPDGTITMDLAISDVHIPAGTRVPKERTMAEISTKKRNALPKNEFADPANRKFPIHDKSHADNAMARLEQQKAKLSPAKYSAIKARIVAAQKHYGEDSSTSKKPKRQLHVRAELAEGGSLHVRHMSDYDVTGGKLVEFPGLVPLDAVQLAAGDGTEKKVWIQLAKCGSFHKRGAFELNAKIFDEIVQNFRNTQNRRIPIDFEHASESDPTEGAIPVVGAPAQGWILDLDNRGEKGLWGLVEWGTLAKDYIKNGQYKFFSPAIRFKSKDRHTGTDAGALMSSGALTNNPFLDGMMPLVAKDFDDPKMLHVEMLPGGFITGEVVPMKAGAFCYSANEYMPQVRAALRMPELSHASACKDAMCTLREMYDAAGHTGVHQGVPLSEYMNPMRDALRLPMSATWEDVFDVVDDLIDAAIDEHEIEYHGGQPPEATEGSADMTELDDDEGDNTDIGAAMSAREPEKDMTEQIIKSKDEEIVTLKATNAENDKELIELRAYKKDAAEKALLAEVDQAFADYQPLRNLTDADKKVMTVTLRHDPEAFHAAYPKVESDKRRFLQPVTTLRHDDRRAGGVEDKRADIVEIAADLRAKNVNLSLGDSLIQAEKSIRMAARG